MNNAQASILRAVFLLEISLFATLRMAALDPHTLISQYGHTVWRAQDGFISEGNSITQTTDGYIWIVEGHTLFRFDGVKFSRWTPPNNQSLPTTLVNVVLGARDGSLWIGTSGGLSHWRDGRLTNYETTPESPGIYKILQDHAGRIWVSRYRINDGMGSLCWAKEIALECYGEKQGNPADYAMDVTEDSKGNIWFGGRALYKWHEGSFVTYFNEQARNQTGDGVDVVAAAPSGEVWAGFDGTGPRAGIQYFLNGKWASYIVPGFDGRNFNAGALFVDSRKTLWIGTNSNGLYHIHHGWADHYGSADGLSNDHVNAIYEDREGNLWVGIDGGIDLFRDNAVIDYSKPQGLTGSDVTSVLAPGGAVWVGARTGLNLIPTGTFSPIRSQKIPGHYVAAMFVDSRGQVWLGADDGVFVYKNGRYAEVRWPNGTPHEQASAFAEDRAGNLWALMHDDSGPGNTHLLMIQDQHVRQDLSLGSDRSSYLGGDRQAGIWVLSFDGKLTHYIDGRAQESVQLGQAYGTYGLEVDAHNTIWVGANTGLYRWSDGHLTLLSPKNGLPCSRVYSFIQDDQGSLWLRTECGILRITADEWKRWLKHPEGKVSFETFKALDGVYSNQTPNLTQPSVAKSRDGRLWFVAGDSVEMVNPDRPTNAIPPPVHIEEVIADHKRYDSLDKVAVPHLRNELEIDYTALSYKIPQKVLFRYKLEGHDIEWNDVGTRREAFYTDLPPRKYRFRVIACNNDGVWNEAGASLDFSILPAWYQTAWFRALCAAAFLLLLWLAYQLRLRQLQHQFNIGLEAQVNERMRIARELHDTLLQSLQAAVFQFQAARRLLLRNADNAMAVVDEAIQAAEGGIKEGRTAIGDLRPEPVAQRSLSELLNATGRELAEAHKLKGYAPSYQVLVEGRQQALSPMLQDEIYRISREVIRNAFLHAVASHIEVEIRYDQDQLRLRIRDDGKGIDPRILEAGGASGHFGIPGMRERALRIGSRLEFWSQEGAGTEVQFTVPASMAYPKRRDGHQFRFFRTAGRDE